jgi:hypothetical protein
MSAGDQFLNDRIYIMTRYRTSTVHGVQEDLLQMIAHRYRITVQIIANGMAHGSSQEQFAIETTTAYDLFQGVAAVHAQGLVDEDRAACFGLGLLLLTDALRDDTPNTFRDLLPRLQHLVDELPAISPSINH